MSCLSLAYEHRLSITLNDKTVDVPRMHTSLEMPLFLVVVPGCAGQISDLYALLYAATSVLG